jgi:hypothetical protein
VGFLDGGTSGSLGAHPVALAFVSLDVTLFLLTALFLD